VRKAGFGKVLIRCVLTDVASLLACDSQLELLPLPIIVTVNRPISLGRYTRKSGGTGNEWGMMTFDLP
jgi:hypothetical protein